MLLVVFIYLISFIHSFYTKVILCESYAMTVNEVVTFDLETCIVDADYPKMIYYNHYLLQIY